MNLTSLDIPNDPNDWPRWIEQQLVGLELGDVVAGLQLLAEPTDMAPQLDELLGDRAAEVFEAGLSVLDPGQIRQFLNHPRLLLELQERVFAGGGAYWYRVPQSDDHRQLVSDQWPQIEAALQDSPQAARTAAQPNWLSSRPLQVVVGLAATLLVVAIGIRLIRPDTPGWGFERADLLTADVPSDEYLRRLGTAANDWFNKRPADAESLQIRLTTFREGCNTLIAAPHPQLDQVDREWLIERCRVWRDKIDGHLAQLAQDPASFPDVLQQADETINRLKTALTDRADSVAG